MNTYVDFSTNHLPHLYRYVLPIAHEDQNREEQIGSGVLVRVRNRHFIATARHCIERNPRIMLGDFFWKNDKIIGAQPVRLLQTEFHDALDLGFLEVEELGLPELQPDQLCCDRIVEGMVHVLGHPVCLIEWDHGRREVILTRSAFGTHLLEEADAFLKFAYPHQGVRFEVDRNEWVTGPFIERPHGFSGGGCFGVTQSSSEGGLHVFGYKLLGIQHEWHKTERWVKAVPIKQWIDLLNERCGSLI